MATVVSGLRGADTQNRSKKATVLPAVKPKNPNSLVFRSKALNYVVVITNPQQIFNQITGRKDLTEKGKYAKFKNYIFETDDEEAIGVIMGLPEYGLGRDIWLLEDERKIQATEAVQNVLATLHSLENITSVPAELRARLAQALGPDIRSAFEPGKE